MEGSIPRVVIESKPLESEVEFEIKSFKDFHLNQQISSKIYVPRLNVTCSIMFWPKDRINFCSSTKTFYFSKLAVNVGGFDETLWKSKKYQLQVTVTAGGTMLIDSGEDHGFKDIDKEELKNVIYNMQHRFDTLEEKLTGDSLVLVFSVKIFSKSASNLSRLNFSQDVLKMNSKMLEAQLFSDFKFVVQGVEFKVHRCVLAAASSVFAKIFSTGLTESKSKQCEVKDIKSEIFKILLEFIYAGKVPENLGDVAKDLFEAAHYYGIQNLKEICKEELPAKLTVQNAVDVYKWAWIYEIEELKVEAWKIIKRDIIKDSSLKEEDLPSVDIINQILHQKSNMEELYNKLKRKKTSN